MLVKDSTKELCYFPIFRKAKICGRMGKWKLLMGTEFQDWKMRSSRDLLHSNVNIVNTTELVLKIG